MYFWEIPSVFFEADGYCVCGVGDAEANGAPFSASTSLNLSRDSGDVGPHFFIFPFIDRVCFGIGGSLLLCYC